MPNRAALIVATGQFDDPGLASLAVTERDAYELEEVLRDPAIGGFEVNLMIDQPIQAVRDQIETFFADRARDDLLLFYFSGHGLKDDRGHLYFAARDTRHDRLASSALPADWVRERSEESRSRSIVILLDCSYSGAFMRTK
jgi:hypothetical protein